MNSPGHVMILASAGSGKTYALTNRFVRLLAGGAAPERIVALTFTRKAAGEFFDEILRKLAQAAADDAAARKLAADIELPALRSPDFLRLLRGMIEAMPRLCLGTLDGFFGRIVRSFPLELGLGGEFTLLEESSARLERRRVLARLFSANREPTPTQKEFIEAYKRATFGVEEKQLGRSLEKFLDEHTENFLAASSSEQWGDVKRIWPAGCDWLTAKGSPAQAAEIWRQVVPWDRLNDKQRQRLEDFLAELPAWQPGASLPKAVDYVVSRALDIWADLSAGQGELMLEKKRVPLDGLAAAGLQLIVRLIVGAELKRKLETTRGIFAVLQGYEGLYDETVRRSGKMTFSDVQRLLLPSAGAPLLSAFGEDERRLLIDWRLDAQFDHWLLDEFQDTSYAQWSILKNLLDEVVQDAEKARTLFYVGDVKQAIYGWREGDARLFREIFNYYNYVQPDAIAEEHLTKSWRSGPAVIKLVNRVFGDRQALQDLVPPLAAIRWSDEWRDHESAKPELGGYAELRHADDEPARFAETLRILREVEPLQRGLSVAVLVQKNDTGTELADYLRREGGLPAVAESDLFIATDNPLSVALLALLRVAAHPGDTFAREHLAMTPLGALLAKRGAATPDELTRTVLAEIFAEGFAATLERWCQALEPHLAADDRFSRLRGRQMVEAARKFDESGRREVAEFLAWAETSKVRDADTAAVVRVLTVHKSKGLGFDLVILPDLEGQSFGVLRRGLGVKKNPDRSVAWVLQLPEKDVSRHDPVLADYLGEKEAETAYEDLCKYYVALTRAKRALYLITEPIGSKSTKRHFPKLLEQTVGDTWSEGDALWYQALQAEQAPLPEPAPMNLPAAQAWPRWRRLPSRRASEAAGGAVMVSLFQADSGGAADFGTQVHALFETIEWWEAARLQDWSAARQAEGVDRVALAEVRACLQVPELARVFARPDAGAEVWRERAFEIVLDGVWVTGVFDRVVLRRDAGGRLQRAEIFDFKTDALRDAAGWESARQRHAAQLGLYKRVAAVLTGLAPAQVGCWLVMTKGPALVAMD